MEPEPFLKSIRNSSCRSEQVEAWLADRQGAVVGKDLAERYGWKIGDRIPLTSPIWQPREPWEFNIVGIYDGGAERR